MWHAWYDGHSASFLNNSDRRVVTLRAQQIQDMPFGKGYSVWRFHTGVSDNEMPVRRVSSKQEGATISLWMTMQLTTSSTCPAYDLRLKVARWPPWPRGRCLHLKSVERGGLVHRAPPSVLQPLGHEISRGCLVWRNQGRSKERERPLQGGGP